MKKILVGLILFFSVFTVGSADRGQDTPNGGGHTPVVVCHLLGHGGYNDLTIDDDALDAHIAHGDLYPVPAGGCPTGQATVTPSPTVVTPIPTEVIVPTPTEVVVLPTEVVVVPPTVVIEPTLVPTQAVPTESVVVPAEPTFVPQNEVTTPDAPASVVTPTVETVVTGMPVTGSGPEDVNGIPFYAFMGVVTALSGFAALRLRKK